MRDYLQSEEYRHIKIVEKWNETINWLMCYIAIDRQMLEARLRRPEAK